MNFSTATLNELTIEGKGFYGIAASAVNYSDSLYTYLRITDIRDDGTLNKEGLKSVNDARARQYVLQPNDIVFARTGASTGRNYFYDGSDGQFVYAGFLIKFSLDPQKVNPKYIKYYCMSDEYKGWIHSFNTGSTRGNINAKMLGNMVIPLPPRTQQDGIVNLLSSIDEKIKKNDEINKNLEALEQAYFCNLFITNANSNWRYGTLSDLGTIVGGGTPSKKHPEYYAKYDIPWITPKDLSIDRSKFISRGENDISELGFSNSSVTKMPKGTILFSSRAPIGYIAIALNTVTTNQGFKSVIPNENVGSAFMYFLLKQALPTIEGMASGSTFKEISGSGMKSVPVVIPDDETLQNFSEFCIPLFEQQIILEAENRRLSSVRDILLPKLMSGKIDVSNIDL